MPYVKLTPPAGVVTEITDYQAGMRYTDADKVRFRYEQAEKIGGWQKRDAFSGTTFSGINRNILPHRDLIGATFIWYGTSTHVYAEYSNTLEKSTLDTSLASNITYFLLFHAILYFFSRLVYLC